MRCHDAPITISPQSIADSNLRESLPHWPTSSLTLAITAILTLIPLSRSSHPLVDSNIPLRRSQALLFAEAALEEVHNEIDRITRAPSQARGLFGERMNSDRPPQLYPIMALSLLSVYECCQRGSISRMRSRANQAVAAAMDFSLHSLDDTSTEAERRAWWSAVSLL